MSDEIEDPASEEPVEQPVDPVQLQFLLQRMRDQQNLALGSIAAAVAALVGAALWAGITLGTGYRIGFMAIGIGLLVGFAVRVFGKGIDRAFGIVGAVFSLLGCAAGNLLAICGLLAAQQNLPLQDVLGHLDAELTGQLMWAAFSPMDLIFYGIAVSEGYRLSFHRLSPEELAVLRPGGEQA